MSRRLAPTLLAALALSACGGASTGADPGPGTAPLASQVRFNLTNITGGWGAQSTYQQTSSVLITMERVTATVTKVSSPPTFTLRQPTSGPSEVSGAFSVSASYPAHPCVYTDSSGGVTCMALGVTVPSIGYSVHFSVSEWSPSAMVTATLALPGPIAFSACRGAIGAALDGVQPIDFVPLSLFLSGQPFTLIFQGNHDVLLGDKQYTEDWSYVVDVQPVP